MLECGQEAVFSLQPEGHLGNEHEVGILTGQRSTRGDEPRMAAHQLHKSDAVGSTTRLDVGASQHLLSLLKRGVVAERGEDELDVVVDSLGNPDNGFAQASAGDFLVDGRGASLGAVAPYAKKDVDVFALQRI